MRPIKFRAWDKENKKMLSDIDIEEWTLHNLSDWEEFYEVIQFTGLYDSKGVEIWEGDVLQFNDKWEWYRGKYGIAMAFAEEDKRKKLQEEFGKEPEERRVVKLIDSYEWMLGNSELTRYWDVIGNIYSNPELLNNE